MVATELYRNQHYAGIYKPSDARKLSDAIAKQNGISRSWTAEHEHLMRVFFEAETDVAASFATTFIDGYRACIADRDGLA